MAEHEAHHEEERTPGGMDIGLVIVVGLALVILVIVTVVAAETWFYNLQRAAVVRAQYAQPNADVRDFRETEEKHLSSVGWADENKTIVHVPIERAMDTYLARQE